MAPECMARRPQLSDPLLFCVFILFFSLLLNNADSLLTYNRETLKYSTCHRETCKDKRLWIGLFFHLRYYLEYQLTWVTPLPHLIRRNALKIGENTVSEIEIIFCSFIWQRQNSFPMHSGGNPSFPPSFSLPSLPGTHCHLAGTCCQLG